MVGYVDVKGDLDQEWIVRVAGVSTAVLIAAPRIWGLVVILSNSSLLSTLVDCADDLLTPKTEVRTLDVEW